MTQTVLLFFNISPGEIFIILLVLFLVFGPSKMPEVARKIGKMINQMKQATSDITNEFTDETKAITQTFEKETRFVKDAYQKTKKEIEKENKTLENELSIKIDAKTKNPNDSKKFSASNSEKQSIQSTDKEKDNAQDDK